MCRTLVEIKWSEMLENMPNPGGVDGLESMRNAPNPGGDFYTLPYFVLILIICCELEVAQ